MNFLFVFGNQFPFSNSLIITLSRALIMKQEASFLLLGNLILFAFALTGHTTNTVNNIVYVFGGTRINTETASKSLQSLDIGSGFSDTTWDKLTEPPIKRTRHSSAAYNQKLYTFGGLNENGEPTNSLLQYDVMSKTWVDLTSVQRGKIPSARYGATFSTTSQGLLLHGGINTVALGDVYLFDTKYNTWSFQSSREERHSHSVTSVGDIIGGAVKPLNIVEV